MRFICDDDEDVATAHYCHPCVLLTALSRARRDETTDSVSRNAAIAVDVGDVTLVSLFYRCIAHFILSIF